MFFKGNVWAAEAKSAVHRIFFTFSVLIIIIQKKQMELIILLLTVAHGWSQKEDLGKCLNCSKKKPVNLQFSHSRRCSCLNYRHPLSHFLCPEAKTKMKLQNKKCNRAPRKWHAFFFLKADQNSFWPGLWEKAKKQDTESWGSTRWHAFYSKMFYMVATILTIACAVISVQSLSELWSYVSTASLTLDPKLAWGIWIYRTRSVNCP